MGLEFGDERLAGGDERLELAGLGFEVAELPEALDDRGSFSAEADEQSEIPGREMSDGVVIEADHADHLAVVLHGRGDFTGGGWANADIAGVAGDVGDELRAGMKSDPAGDALAEPENDFAVIGGEADLGLDFEATVVGVEERDRAGGAFKVSE